MKSLVVNLFAVLALFSGTLLVAGQHPISFYPATGSIPAFNAPENSPVALAYEAFSTKYGAETGVLGAVVGSRGQLLVLVTHMRVASEVWRKMVGAGDAFTGNGGMGYFRYQDANGTGLTGYVFAGKIQISEGSSGKLVLPNGTPEISSFLVAMDNKCIFTKGGVQAVAGTPILPTKLVSSRKEGSFTMVYEHSVNGGAGALLSAIVVTLGTRHPLGFITDICPVDIYVKY